MAAYLAIGSKVLETVSFLACVQFPNLQNFLHVLILEIIFAKTSWPSQKKEKHHHGIVPKPEAFSSVNSGSLLSPSSFFLIGTNSLF